MKAITIKQPYASLIMAGIKKYEFRTWKTKFRGEILIHAGKTIDAKAMEKFKRYNLDYPKGVILGKVSIVDCLKVDDELREKLYKENALVYGRVATDKTWDGYAFQVANPEKLENIEVLGKLGIWEYK